MSTENLNIPISQVKFEIWTRVEGTMVFMPYLSHNLVDEKCFEEIDKIGFTQNSFEPHQPNMHIANRSLPLWVHKYHLPDPFQWFWPIFGCNVFLPLQVVPTTSKERFRISSLQPTCLPVAHEDDVAPCYYMFSVAELCNMLAFGYAICTVYFSGSCVVIEFWCNVWYFILNCGASYSIQGLAQ